jgi:isochorismate synthase
MELNRTILEDALPVNDEGQGFLFSSSYKSIRAHGVFTQITEPAINGGAEDSPFQLAIKHAFERAKLAGIAKPIVMGAVPFDVSQPSCLYIPVEHAFVSATTLHPLTVAQAVTPISITRAISIPDERRFKQSVEQAVANFHFSDIRKAVLSRVLELELASGLDLDTLFANLMRQNPSGYHFRLPMQDGGDLIGVSPELLIRKQAGEIWSNPLAGSAKRQQDKEQDIAVSHQLKGSLKDSYEHSLVIDDIRRILTPLCQQLEVPSTPELCSTSAMWHLSTQINGQLWNKKMSALQLACLLHPTPAVCGSPSKDARKLINLVEGFDRGLFTGMVGWCNEDGDGEWVVTIRCGIVKDKLVRLFAGAGIVKGSCPESEWLETQAKLGTMLTALGLHSVTEA